MIAILLAAGAASALQAEFSSAKLEGFAGDGKSALFDASIGAPSEPGKQVPWAEHVWVSIAEDGRPLHVARYVESRADDSLPNEVELTPEAKQLWESAEDVDHGRALQRAVKGNDAQMLSGSSGELKGPAKAKSRVEQAGAKGCPAQRLYIDTGGRDALVFEDPCMEDEQAPLGTTLTYAWNTQGTALAVAWGVGRRGARRGYLAVVTPSNIGGLDLLIAGGEPSPALEKLAQAGFRVVHQGKAVKAREQSAVYFAPGFAQEAAQVAQALGLAAGAVQPLNWKTPYAITVALGR